MAACTAARLNMVGSFPGGQVMSSFGVRRLVAALGFLDGRRYLAGVLHPKILKRHRAAALQISQSAFTCSGGRLWSIIISGSLEGKSPAAALSCRPPAKARSDETLLLRARSPRRDEVFHPRAGPEPGQPRTGPVG